MSYAGTNKGGTSAILAAEALLHERSAASANIPAEDVYAAIPELVDQVMGEGGLWAPEVAARAVLQAAGDTAEAVHLLRSHRSTLPRLAFTEPVDPDSMQLCRRVIPAHRQPDGPQLLGASFDYSPRLIAAEGGDPLGVGEEELLGDNVPTIREHADRPVQRFTQWLRERDLLTERGGEVDEEPYDLTLRPITLPASRFAVLSAMTIAETGALVNTWYRGVTGPDGHTDESVTLGDVRYGHLDIRVTHPHIGRPVTVVQIDATDAEAVDCLDSRGEDTSRFEAGYGFALGHNERKAIAMSAMDLAATRFADTPAGDHLEQVLMHTTDGLAANGLLEHLKLPHYVTFHSQVDRAFAAAAQKGRTTP